MRKNQYQAGFHRKKLILLAVAMLAGIAVLVSACGQAQEPEETGPNARLNNNDLVKLAVTTMKAYKSYHMEFHGGVPSEDIQMSRNLTITSDLQFDARGFSIQMSDDGIIEGAPYLMLGIGPAGIQVRNTKDGWFESYDGGVTWQKATTDTPGSYLMSFFGWWWNERSSGMPDATPYPSVGEDMIKGLTFTDGNPRLEEVDGAVTRHVVASLDKGSATPDILDTTSWGEGWARSATEVDIWVTTDISPTIRQMKIHGNNSVAKNEVGPANALAFSPDGHMLAVAHGHAQDWTVRLWDINKPESTPRKFSGAKGPFGSVAFSQDGKWLAAGAESGGAPSVVYLWDVTAPDTQPVQLAVPSSAKSVAFGDGGSLLAVGASDGVYVWTAPFKDAAPEILAGSTGVLVNIVTFSKDGKRLAAGTLDSGVLVYDLEQPQSPPVKLTPQWVVGLAFSPDGFFLASAGDPQMNNGDMVELWDLRDLSQHQPTPVGVKSAEIGSMSIAFSPDGKWFAAINREGNPVLWEVAKLLTGEATKDVHAGEASVKFLLPQGEEANTLIFNQDGTALAALSDSNILLWEISANTIVGTSIPAPTVLMVDEQVTDTPYILTWKWSRFSEDFGEVKTPLPETIR